MKCIHKGGLSETMYLFRGFCIKYKYNVKHLNMFYIMKFHIFQKLKIMDEQNTSLLNMH